MIRKPRRSTRGVEKFPAGLIARRLIADKSRMKRSAPNVQRMVVAIMMCIAFVVMASVFVPLQSGANDRWNAAEPALSHDDSVDPHEGLASIGSFEHHKYLIRVYATDGGPRFSIYSTEDGSEVAALMSAANVTRHFPEIPIEGTDFSAPFQLMRAEPASARSYPW